MFEFRLVNYNQAINLSSLGFPQIRTWCYDIKSKSINDFTNDYLGYQESKTNLVTAPYNEQVINWFRIFKDIDLYIRPCYEKTNKGTYEKVGYTYEIGTLPKYVLNPCLTYEEAQRQGIDAALEYLIQKKGE